ncbi:MAG: TM2 domain-containing protein [Anaerovoracaceae bacterium]
MLNEQVIKSYIGSEHTQELEALSANIAAAGFPKVNLKSPKLTLVLSIILGFLGLDRLYQGGIKMFAYKLLMIVFTFGIWWIADIYFCRKATEEDNYNKLASITA